MKNNEQGQKIVIAERDNIAAVLENGKVSGGAAVLVRLRRRADGQH